MLLEQNASLNILTNTFKAGLPRPISSRQSSAAILAFLLPLMFVEGEEEWQGYSIWSVSDVTSKPHSRNPPNSQGFYHRDTIGEIQGSLSGSDVTYRSHVTFPSTSSNLPGLMGRSLATLFQSISTENLIWGFFILHRTIAPVLSIQNGGHSTGFQAKIFHINYCKGKGSHHV